LTISQGVCFANGTAKFDRFLDGKIRQLANLISKDCQIDFKN